MSKDFEVDEEDLLGSIENLKAVCRRLEKVNNFKKELHEDEIQEIFTEFAESSIEMSEQLLVREKALAAVAKEYAEVISSTEEVADMRKGSIIRKAIKRAVKYYKEKK